MSSEAGGATPRGDALGGGGTAGPATQFGIGQPVPRVEDPRLVTGRGRFTDDLELPGQAWIAFCRSPHPHGRIVRIGVDAARRAAGVLAVYRGTDLAGLGGLPCVAQLEGVDGAPAFIPHRPALPTDRVRYVGQAVAAVVAETLQQARDAADLVELEVEALPVAIGLAAAAAPDAPSVHDEHGSNLCVHWRNGDAASVDAAIAAAAHVTRVTVVNNRVAPGPLEPQSSLAAHESGRLTLYNPSQGAFAQRNAAAAIFGMERDAVRVVSGDTGGGFGVRGGLHPETVMCLFAARDLERPVKWRGDRSDMFLADCHGRDNVTTGTLALDAEGRMVALKVETLANLGAYCSNVGPFVPTLAGGRVCGTVYRVANICHDVRCVFTNTMPVSAYRGAGRPEAAYITERLIEAAARELGMDSRELRRRNFIRPQDLPYTNHAGMPIASGAFEETMDLAVARADWEGFPVRREASARAGKLRGIGLGCYIESSGGAPQEEARVAVDDDGAIEAVVGTYSHGQGHETAFAQIIAETFGVGMERVRLVQGDTARVRFGGGTGGSRSGQMGGVAVLRAAREVIEQGAGVAAEALQVERDRIGYQAGVYAVADGTGRMTLAEAARAAPGISGAALAETLRYQRDSAYTFPNGCHVAEVEIDPETGVVQVVKYTAVDDCGRVINPLLAAGQVHGGVAQGLGQALLEAVRYDADGQLVTGSYMDYAVPRAAHVPSIGVSFNEVLEPGNELGAKGIGEGGACGAPPAIVHAALDALAPLGVTALDMPLTPERVWRAVREARG